MLSKYLRAKLYKVYKVTCVDPLPVLGRTRAVLSLSTDAHPVALPAAQRADVAGGAVGGAGLQVCDVKGIGRGVVVKNAAAGRPGNHRRVGVAGQGSLQTAVGTRTYTERQRFM